MESEALAISFAILGLSYGLGFRLEMFKHFIISTVQDLLASFSFSVFKELS